MAKKILFGVSVLAVLLLDSCNAIVGGACDLGNDTQISQAQLDSIRADCSLIEGNVDIQCTAQNEISSLKALRQVERITGYLRIVGCSRLTDLSSLWNLKAVDGSWLHEEPGVGSGFAIYIADNANLKSLNGFQNLTSIGKTSPYPLKGRVYISQNPELCWADKLNWRMIFGDTYIRFVYENVGTNCVGEKICDAQCSCGHCVGPNVIDCIGTCESFNDNETVLLVTLVVVIIVVGLVGAFLFLYVTDRCGCRVQHNAKTWFIGHFPSTDNAAHARRVSVKGEAWTETLLALKHMDANNRSTASPAPNDQHKSKSTSFEPVGGGDDTSSLHKRKNGSDNGSQRSNNNQSDSDGGSDAEA